MKGSFSPHEQMRIERLKNRRGRKKPAKIPARLARTSAFAPKRRGLNTDSRFERVYVVPGQSIVRVHGRELGTQHRDLFYAIQRIPSSPKPIKIEDKHSPLGFEYLLQKKTTWREICNALGLVEHANNVASIHLTTEELMQVSMTIYEGKEELILEQIANGRLPNAAGSMRHILHEVTYSGISLDDEVIFTYGRWVTDKMQSLHLVSLNADVQFALNSDYAKSFWPYIDSFTKFSWVDEEMLASLVGRELFGENETSSTRRDFRAVCRKAFDDMVRAGGLSEWHEEIRGKGRKKTRRYHYSHALGQQMELALDDVTQENNE